MNLHHHSYDAVIVGAGGAGLRAAESRGATDAWPRGIEVTQAIEEVKREILFSRV